VYRKRRPFDLITESLYLSDDGRASMLLIDAAGLAVQVHPIEEVFAHLNVELLAAA